MSVAISPQIGLNTISCKDLVIKCPLIFEHTNVHCYFPMKGTVTKDWHWHFPTKCTLTFPHKMSIGISQQNIHWHFPTCLLAFPHKISIGISPQNINWHFPTKYPLAFPHMSIGIFPQNVHWHFPFPTKCPLAFHQNI